MEEIRVFENSEFGELEVLSEEEKMYFPASACAKKLGYSNPKQAVIDHCRWVVKRDLPHPQNRSKTITMNFIPEGDLYRLIVHSKLPGAERFEKWVFDEVLPSIRRTGGYAPDTTALIVSTVQTAVAETIRAMMPVFLSPEAQKALTRKRTYRKTHCAIGQMDAAVQADIEEMILENKLTYQGICDYLHDTYGIQISKSAVGRYASRLYDQMERDADKPSVILKSN